MCECVCVCEYVCECVCMCDEKIEQGVARDSVVERGNFYFKLYRIDKITYYFLISRTHNAELWAKSSNISENSALDFMRWMVDSGACVYPAHILSVDELDIYHRTFPDDDCDAPESVPSEFNYPQDSDDEMSESAFLNMIYE